MTDDDREDSASSPATYSTISVPVMFAWPLRRQM